uniref:Uncharacterized protein n=2 Tax=Caenorhabditis japonica TaxID=281687 RepID=A0A8R1E3F1_CAEJA
MLKVMEQQTTVPIYSTIDDEEWSDICDLIKRDTEIVPLIDGRDFRPVCSPLVTPNLNSAGLYKHRFAPAHVPIREPPSMQLPPAHFQAPLSPTPPPPPPPPQTVPNYSPPHPPPAYQYQDIYYHPTHAPITSCYEVPTTSYGNPPYYTEMSMVTAPVSVPVVHELTPPHKNDTPPSSPEGSTLGPIASQLPIISPDVSMGRYVSFFHLFRSQIKSYRLD